MALPSPLSTERLVEHGRDKNKEQTPSTAGATASVVETCRKAINCVRRRNCPMQLPCWPPEGRKGSETPSRLASHAWPAHKSPSLREYIRQFLLLGNLRGHLADRY